MTCTQTALGTLHWTNEPLSSMQAYTHSSPTQQSSHITIGHRHLRTCLLRKKLPRLLQSALQLRWHYHMQWLRQKGNSDDSIARLAEQMVVCCPGAWELLTRNAGPELSERIHWYTKSLTTFDMASKSVLQCNINSSSAGKLHISVHHKPIDC